jgi:hypothetical protein
VKSATCSPDPRKAPLSPAVFRINALNASSPLEKSRAFGRASSDDEGTLLARIDRGATMDPVTSPLIHKDSGRQARVDPGEENPFHPSEHTRAATAEGWLQRRARVAQIPIMLTASDRKSVELAVKERWGSTRRLTQCR